MTTDLAQQTCESCRTDAPTLTEQQLDTALQQLPQWSVVTESAVNRLEKDFSFENFEEAIKFACRVAEIAETANHHPALLVEWGSVKVQWWSHKIGGIHQNDAIMAAKTDSLYSD